jgi:predicted NAD/FAD-binding protein
MKRIAVIGAGIAGIAAAYQLSRRHAVTLIEGAPRIGGHTDTHDVVIAGERHRVDSGFIVFNETNYPGFSTWLAELGVGTQPSDMSFGVSLPHLGLEYGTKRFAALFSDRTNLVRPRFMGMLRDLVRFYRDARTLDAAARTLTLGEYLARNRYGEAFAEGHLVPMCAALWSAPECEAREIALDHIVRFMDRHRMLELAGRPEWRVVTGGSAVYVDRFLRSFRGEVQLGTRARAVHRSASGVRVVFDHAERTFDAVFLACHSDQALALLAEPTAAERAVLGAIGYRRNRVVVHSDVRAMPARRAAWSSWNVVRTPGADRAAVTYWMNQLQSIRSAAPILVTVEPAFELDPALVHVSRDYAHPVFTHAAVAAQRDKPSIDGTLATYYCGAYWGAGFHEDGFQSAASAVAAFERHESSASIDSAGANRAA